MLSAGSVLDAGVVGSSSISGGVTQITDSGKNWGSNVYVSQVIYFPRMGQLFSITTNTGTSISFTGEYTAIVGEAYFLRKVGTSGSGTTGKVSMIPVISSTGAVIQITGSVI